MASGLCHRCLRLVRKRSIFTAERSTKIIQTLNCISPSQLPARSFVTSRAHLSLFDKLKTVFTGNQSQDVQTDAEKSPQTKPENPVARDSSSFTLEKYADELKKARRLGSLSQFFQGRGSEPTLTKAFEKNEAITRVLAAFDPTGEHLNAAHKAEAVKQCNCTVQEVEDALARFVLAKEAERKISKLKEEGKPMPTTLAELQELIGSYSMKTTNGNLARKVTEPVKMENANIQKSRIVSRNQLCPCGSQKKYKRMDEHLRCLIFGLSLMRIIILDVL
eukprot:TRINITY_DN13313_c0_g2_i1.p1 TRINITY_DN13313_c0_g2~~TRINITY_DN13313_c0_g2_i1.p1  ORF type:complete len:277 (+),score=51.46 TRINITY_DN13313_c0_g2_i1:242-1072(+)